MHILVEVWIEANSTTASCLQQQARRYLIQAATSIGSDCSTACQSQPMWWW